MQKTPESSEISSTEENVEAVNNTQDEYTPGQLMRVAAVYEFIAKLIPVEGRDYSVKFIFPEKDNPSRLSVKMDHYTSIGKIWCDYCMESMRAAMDKK